MSRDDDATNERDESSGPSTTETDAAHSDATRAIVAARSEDDPPDTTEIRELAAAAGYAVVGEVTQRRREDPTYDLGRGKAEELMRLAADADAEAVIYDGSLSPGQTFSLGDLLPTGTAVVDRPRLALELFADAADSRAADRQLELARLRYELPRLREAVARDASEDVRLRPEGDSRVLDVEKRIESAERALDEIADDRAARRAERRDAGFDLIALAGYTNAGKSTLARRLADEVDDPDFGAGASDRPAARADTAAGDPADDAGALAVADRPFETLSTTTRRATVAGRRTLLTDTVGFLDGLPHEAVRSFRATIDAVRAADCALLVVDASDDPAALRRKLSASLSAIEATDGPVVPVLSKVDEVDADGLASAVEAYETVVAELGPRDAPVADALRSPVPVSVRDESGLGDLADAVADALPTATATVEVQNGGDAQAALSWAYDRAVVAGVEYGGETMAVDLAGRPDVVAEAERRLRGAGSPP
ncbi:50S ribosome-binding GTPase [Halorubrum ezzemoulense]|uniref:50S ribosome-binding GTPase n=1 Tax=Halorubrum ezzemoulense TaxID=337243 RepID=A0ABT4YYN7_HALEZ|nr:GTPase [Halorubrum ezzemoulense]MDB2245567.1 50S ribosome-binding GTPase [Halorubrum ezzemoulense]MDB2250453.1 50S ribosome-binding GTPase [Halorubrum ezzemoulense]MDB2279055.1 50S ribosome-binding GTPase [Halorubrum ezzemoulense]MDB2285709.1 50S ribosome-binding GTPase [Halorubrum ezzemoulense]MDB2287523.1 50S ribosome-binding GTPase [Halorubrum ezzemoulense]